MRSGASWLLLICIVVLLGGMAAFVAPSPLKRDHLIPKHRFGPDHPMRIEQSSSSIMALSGPVHTHNHAHHVHSHEPPSTLLRNEASAGGHVLPRGGITQKIIDHANPAIRQEEQHMISRLGISRGGSSVNSPLPWEGAAPEDPMWMQEAHRRCDRILRQLWEKQGGIALPDIQVSEIHGYGKPAEYDLAGKRILIDPKAYQLCLNLPEYGEEALAFLIAHELIHSYQHHSFDYQSLAFFVKSTSLKGWAENDRKRRKSMETQADIWGAVLCYMAGYKVDQSIPVFIDQLYAAFGLDEEDPGYDSKRERLEIATRAQEEVKKSIDIFEMATYMSVLQEHDKDTTLYRYLIDQFRSAEFYNNLGVSYIRLALPKIQEPYRSLPYPFLLDTETRLQQAISKRKSSPGSLLRQGILNFDLISDLNSRYSPAYLNQAIAYHLLSVVEENHAAAHIQTAKENLSVIEKSSYRSQVKLVRRLIDNPQANSTKVRAYVELGEPEEISGLIDQIDFSDGYALDDLEYDWETTVSFAEGISVSGLELPNSRLLCFEDRSRFTHAYLQLISKPVHSLPPSYRQVLQVGSKVPIEQQQSMRKSLPNSNGGYFLIHDELAIVYRVSASDIVQEWGLWREW